MSIVFKCEDEVNGEAIGPVTEIDEVAMKNDPIMQADKIGVPYGYEPEWLTEHGWMIESEAKKLAAARGVSLEVE